MWIGTLCALCVGPLKAENPIVQTSYTADAASLVYKGRFYVYVGRDEASPTGRWFSMREWRVYSSADMVNWTDHGPVLRTTDFSWSSGDAWASQCVYDKGKFYWYISTSHKTKGGKAVGVAVGDSPLGPFKDLRGEALITTDMTPKQGDFDDIDPTVYIDPKGQAYMYWGNGKCKYVKLTDDRMHFSGNIEYAAVPKFGEAPWLQQINRKYYLSYSSSSPSTIEYCTGDSPVGPWTYENRILNVVENCPTSHQAISFFKGHWYLVYHNGALPGGNGFRRSVCIDEFVLGSDGKIPLVTPTREGVKPVGQLNPFTRVEAETMAWSVGLETATDGANGVYLTAIHASDYLKLRSVNFKKNPSAFVANVASQTQGGSIELHVDALDGPLLGTCLVPDTQGPLAWRDVTCPVTPVKGVHDLYLVFKGGEGPLFQFNYWKFK
jgi:beta-xylosidase